MLNSFVFKSLPYLFLMLFIFLEFTPSYFFEDQIIKPYMFITILYCWIANDFKKFSPLSIFFLCTLYDLIQSDIVGITSIFFLITIFSHRRNFNELISNDFKETWIKFILSLTVYVSVFLFLNLSFSSDDISFKNAIISYIFSIALFPLFFSIVNKLSLRFRSYDQ